ncbi:MAG TPA: dihydroorotate dehydrogenase electron transfer subunit [Candidatus Avoscillospira stercoripullorum]|uniref:Dihydroorotate dehydrogenase B (NAD(+)), electron transfer subunit n=1 Tax=Candidatus Avoscillospira stercoripullorum TaxID=2840709 RepID=A0A9D1A7X9_9FIRM|nr:dihydroorotate dehydrogenase electron transfer subunit [Candidatus Avoscillospira stercoripullorum]
MQQICRVLENAPLTPLVWKMRLSADTSAITAPGQFVNIHLPGLYLRRPISICDWDEESLTLIYKVVGKGTDAMTRIKPPHRLDLLVGLGNGYDTTKSGQKPLLLGGGVGVPPLYGLCKALLGEGKDVTVILGFNAREELFYEEEFKALGVKVFVTTVDGSYGEKGFVTDVMKNLDYTYFYTCGPGPMFRAIEKTAVTSGQFSFEARMGCGFGACMGCSMETKSGAKRVCKDGPVFEREEILW